MKFSQALAEDSPFRAREFIAGKDAMTLGTDILALDHPDGEAKFWIEPELEASVVAGLSPRQVAEAEDIVRRHLQEVRDAWVRHFSR